MTLVFCVETLSCLRKVKMKLTQRWFRLFLPEGFASPMTLQLHSNFSHHHHPLFFSSCHNLLGSLVDEAAIIYVNDVSLKKHIILRKC